VENKGCLVKMYLLIFQDRFPLPVLVYLYLLGLVGEALLLKPSDHLLEIRVDDEVRCLGRDGRGEAGRGEAGRGERRRHEVGGPPHGSSAVFSETHTWKTQSLAVGASALPSYCERIMRAALQQDGRHEI